MVGFHDRRRKAITAISRFISSPSNGKRLFFNKLIHLNLYNLTTFLDLGSPSSPDSLAKPEASVLWQSFDLNYLSTQITFQNILIPGNEQQLV
jgi:hypothetical protein